VEKFLQLTLTGLVTGAIYSIMGSGLALTYTTSGIFNFAHGAIAFAAAYLYYQLHVGLGMPIVPALIISVFLFAPLTGLLLDRILLRRLSHAPVYARIVGTIGLLVMLPSFVQWLVATLGIQVFHIHGLVSPDNLSQGASVPGVGPNPPHTFHLFDHVVLDSNELAVFVVAALAAVGLWYVIRRTRLGLQMRAVVDRESLAGLRGVNAVRTSAVAWVLTMVLAGLGGVLIAPLFTLADYIYTLVVLGALAAVVLAGLRSIPIVFIGGLALGMLQNWVAGYSDTLLPGAIGNLTGLKPALPFVLVIIFLLAFRRDRTRRAGTAADDAPRPDHRQGLPAWRRRLPWAIAVVVLIAYAEQWFSVSWFRADNYGQTVIAQGLAMAIIFLSFVVITGMGGLVSLAQATFVTAGGMAAGWAVTRDWGVNIPLLATHGRLDFVWIVIFAAIVAAAVGGLIGVSLTRLDGVTFALGTLAFALICDLVVFPTQLIGHGDAGWTIPQPSFSIPGLNQLNDLLIPGHQARIDTSLLSEQILLFLAVFGLLTLCVHAFMRSASGRATLAVRSSEVAAEASGIRIRRIKVLLLMLSAGIAGIGGVMLGLFNFQMTASTAPPLAGLIWLALAVTFGVRRPGGALIGGLVFTGGTAVFHWVGKVLPGGGLNTALTSPYFIPMLSGLGAIQLAQEPDGILSFVGQRRRAKKREKERRARIEVAEASLNEGTLPPHERERVAGGLAAAASPDAAMSFRGIVAGYGDLEVLHGVDLDLAGGSVVALLGANGAGKSTLCSVAAGLVAPTEGRVTLRGEDVTSSPSYARARSGLLVVPEARGIFPGLTVADNLEIALPDPALRDAAYERFPVLEQRRRQNAGLLSGGEQQMLSLAPALADPPKVFIADEPTLGLAPMLADVVLDAIAELRSLGTAVLLVEEHARNAMKIADTLVLMELGSVRWSGSREDADVSELTGAYLGAGS
jgi:ABC-type branched-subunit amino acid transport system ATPase component/branched-subunit amino acid ABC-type transport system permease component